MNPIHALIGYGLEQKLIENLDVDYVNNQVANLLSVEPVPFKMVDVNNQTIDQLLKPLLDMAYTHKKISTDSLVERDLFESLIMDYFTPRPSDYQKHFGALYEISPMHATSDFYHRSQASNYIKTARIKKNTHFQVDTPYGLLDITINLSKPEKDPKLIAKALKASQTSYPSCLLCKENVGYYGSLNHPGRSNHRVIKVNINEESFFMQYSPYVYYNEHTILLHESHIPMDVNINTFKRLIDFVDLFPHYFMGSNAGLPIVGGSILNHEHYQGGNATFPIDQAKVLKTFTHDTITIDMLYWPLSTLRLKSKDKKALIDFAEHLRQSWLNYSNPTHDIIAYTHDTPHNAITPIARKEGNDYALTIALRNNRTNETYPDGIFHPHKDKHHIKKENIGLIEVMGLAILPGRLDQDLRAIKAILQGKAQIDDTLSLYKDWILSLQETVKHDEAMDQILNEAVGNIFKGALEDCGVFKQTQSGIEAFTTFIKESIDDYENE
jgi:UDPglucose--hexose-1-phosphate uridylyltransferase